MPTENRRAIPLARSPGGRAVDASHGTVEFVVDIARDGLAEAV